MDESSETGPEAPFIETSVTLNLEELVILAALVAKHRLEALDKVPENHWQVLMTLSGRVVNALVRCTDELKRRNKLNESNEPKSNGGGGRITPHVLGNGDGNDLLDAPGDSKEAK